MMKKIFELAGVALLVSTTSISCASTGALEETAASYGVPAEQVARWSSERDLEDFFYGSLSTEVLPERALGAWIAANPDLFPGGSLSAHGVPDPRKDGRTIGFSRKRVKHLGNQFAVGVNCAACHVSEVYERKGGTPLLILGRPGLFDPYSFIGATAVAMGRSATPKGMKAFLPHYLRGTPGAGALEAAWSRQEAQIAAAISEDPFGSKGVAAGTLHEIRPEELEFDGKNLVPLVRGLLKLFHNIRTALHLPTKLPPPVKSPSGPGRNDAFNVLAAAFFGAVPRLEAPAKFGMMWNLEDRRWVHWDGNNDSAMSRNLGASMGLGGPTAGKGKLIDYAAVTRQTEITERIRSPRYPWSVDRERARRGAAHYRKHCASCHDASGDARLIAVDSVGTDPNRALIVDAPAAAALNRWTAERNVEGYRPRNDSWRHTGKYWASDLAGVWARSPYLHNGSVRTMRDLLASPANRPKSFRIGSRVFSAEDMGFLDEGRFVFDTRLPGNSNAGHDYGTGLTDSEIADLIEYLKTL